VTQENVEVVRRAWEAWKRRDIDGLFALYDPEIVWDMSHYDDVISGVFRGHEGVRRFFRQWLEPFETYHAHAENFIDAGDSVVVEVRQGGRGKASKAHVEMPVYWQVYNIRNGLVMRVEPYKVKAEAYEAAGLAEDAPKT
jgi:ketosteroid isomerase-like protein